MKKLLKKRRRGDIMVVLAFSIVMAILMLGMLRVAMTYYAAGRAQERQYADIQTMRAINDTVCYSYITDLMACLGTKNVDAEMPGTSDSVIYHESLDAIQKALSLSDQPTIWRVQDAGTAISAANFDSPDTQAALLSLVLGKAHSFTLRLENDFTFDVDDLGESYFGEDEARIKLKPVLIETVLKVKSETVTGHYSVEGLYLYVQKSTRTETSGNTFTQADIRITDDGEGSGVHIYRAD